MNRPLTTMLPRNAAPTRKLIVADPDKLDYFARAAYVRAGAAGTWGALQGLGNEMPEQDTASASNTKAPGALSTVSDWFRSLGNTIFSGGQQQMPPPPPAPEPSPVPVILGVAATGLALFAVYKVMKKA